MSISRLRLHLISLDAPSLYRSEVVHESTGDTLLCVRGKTSGAFRDAGTFQWSRAVQAVTILLLRHKLEQLCPSERAVLIGDRDSLASSLDYAISKRPVWLSDMFGSTAAGDCFASRLFRRSNPNRKRAGPVAISINDRLLASSAVEVIFEGRQVDVATLKSICEALSEHELEDAVTTLAA